MSKVTLSRSVWEETGVSKSKTNNKDDNLFTESTKKVNHTEVEKQTRSCRRILYILIAVLSSILLALVAVLIQQMLTRPGSATTNLSTQTKSTTSSTSVTTATTVTTTTTAIPCILSTVGKLDSYGSSPPTSWTNYTYSYTATSTKTMIRFSSQTNLVAKDWYIDDVVIVDTANPSTNLVLNGDFESGPSIGWQVNSCNQSCIGAIMSSAICNSGSGSCYHNDCTPADNIQFIDQVFNTNINSVYSIKVSLLRNGGGVGPTIEMYLNVF